MQLRFRVTPLIIVCGVCFMSCAVIGADLKYLPRLGMTPLRFLAPMIPVVPAPLPPLDMGDAKATDPSAEDAPDGGGEQEKKKPERRTRSMSVSSRESGQANGDVQGRKDGGETGLGKNEGDGAAVAPHSMVDPNSLLPDGFQLEPDGLPGDRQDLRVFLNYFVGPRKSDQTRGPTSDEKSP